MSRKSFWNWLGLPSFADIQALQESARRQEDALASLVRVNAEAKEALVTIQADLSDSVDRVNNVNRSMLEVVEKNVCESVQRDIDSSRSLLSGQLSQLTQEALAAAKSELVSVVEHAGGEQRAALDTAEQRISAAMRTCTENAQSILSKQADELSESIAALSTLCDTAYSLDKDTQARIEHIITECKTQNELLRMLLANTLIDDVSQKLFEEPIRRELVRRNK